MYIYIYVYIYIYIYIYIYGETPDILGWTSGISNVFFWAGREVSRNCRWTADLEASLAWPADVSESSYGRPP